MFSCEFFETIKDTFFYKNSPADYFVDWKNAHDYWLKISFYGPLRFLILIDSILMDLAKECRLKSEGIH